MEFINDNSYFVLTEYFILCWVLFYVCLEDISVHIFEEIISYLHEHWSCDK
jgi:hypothetical protein